MIRLDTLGVLAVALCSNAITCERAERPARLAREFAGGIVTIFLDCDPEGETGMKQAPGYLAQLVPGRIAWTSNMYGGKFKGRQPEPLRDEECAEIFTWLRAALAHQLGLPLGRLPDGLMPASHS